MHIKRILITLKNIIRIVCKQSFFFDVAFSMYD